MAGTGHAVITSRNRGHPAGRKGGYPDRGTWKGGWVHHWAMFNLEACRTRAGTGCETLSAQDEDPLTCPGVGAVIGRRYRGWWLRGGPPPHWKDTVKAGVGLQPA